MKWRSILGCLFLALCFFLGVSLSSGFHVNRARAQAGEESPPKQKQRHYQDIINWSWSLAGFGYGGSIAIRLWEVPGTSQSGSEKTKGSQQRGSEGKWM